MAKNNVKIELDASAFISFTEIFESFLKRRVVSLDSSDLPFEIARVDCDCSAASTGKLIVRLYPSDAFLAFVGAIFAGNFDFSTIEKVSHN
jgi:hypothetical protein